MKKLLSFSFLFFFNSMIIFSQAVIANHRCTKIDLIPESAIIQAEQKLHIAYGHTSHGSQITDGMSGLKTFMNNKGYPIDLYSWNNGGTAGALDLHDYAMGGDVGYYPDWVNNTRSYLGAPNPDTGRGTGGNADVNVIIWSWCGQVSSKYAAGTLKSEYLDPMVKLEQDYFGIKFIYMTGHLDHWDDTNNKAANKMIRDFCITNNKILYDFADIESYDPDGKYYEFAGDDCSYYESLTGKLLGNWAVEWQNKHTEGVDWYNCGAAHSQPLNANQKAYAAWWLWATLSGWDYQTAINDQDGKISIYPNPTDGKITINSTEKGYFKTLDIFDSHGRKVFYKSQIESNYEIDLSELKPGIYFIKIDDGQNTFIREIIFH